jgi:hypothetical protein
VRARIIPVVIALAMVIAACGGGGGDGGGESAGGVVSADVGNGPNAVPVAYVYQPGEELTYRFDMKMDMTATMDGVAGGDMVMGMDVYGRTSYAVSEGSQPGTTRITLDQQIDDIAVRTLTVDGQSMAGQLDDQMMEQMAFDQGMLPELAVVLDARGDVLAIEYDGQAMPMDMFGGDLFGGMDPTGGMTGLDSFFGPTFPGDSIGVGDSWTINESQEVPMVGTMSFSEQFTVSDSRMVGGREVLVIDSVMSMDRLEIDLFEAMMSIDPATAQSMGMTSADLEMMKSMMPSDFSMKMAMEIGDATARYFFDPSEGVVLRTDAVVTMDMSVDMKAEGESMDMVAGVTMDMTLELIGRDAPPATATGA